MSREIRPAPCRWFRYEDFTYTIINPSPVESLPGLATDDLESNLTCKDMRKALWALSKAPEMAYMLKRFNVESTFMARLNCEAENIPIVKTTNGYALRHDVRTSWKRLEAMFIPITTLLMDSQNLNPERQFSWSAHWSLPNEFGYLQNHETGAAARKAAMRARDACVLLLARCSMAIALCDRPGNQPPTWIRALQGRVPNAWIDVLRESIVADFSAGLRAGAFIDLSGKTAWVHHVPCMIRANLPVYICWNVSPHTAISEYPFLKPYLPPPVPIPTVMEESQSSLCFRWPTNAPMVPAPSVASSTSSRAHPGPKLPHGIGQKPGEGHKDFFARRDASDEESRRRASPSQIALYNQRLQKAASYNRPCHPTEVFVWKPAGEEDPMLPEELIEMDLRVCVGYRAVGELWPMYPTSHKVYNAWRDEWDICPMLAPRDELAYEDEDDDLDDIFGSTTQPVPGDIAHTSIQLSQMYETELALYYEDGETMRYQPFIEAFRSIARFRYGLTAVTNEVGNIAYDKHGETAIRTFFGLVREEMNADAIQVVRSASGFIASWMHTPDDPWAPGILWDLESTSNLYLPRQMRSLPIRLTVFQRQDDRDIAVTYQGDCKLSWTLFVDDVTALELCRRSNIVTIRDAALFLLQRGTRVAMAVSMRRTYGRVPQGPAFQLGWRPNGVKLNGWDYKEYEHTVRNMLTNSRARAAILRGGIAWRLAVEILGEDGVLDAVRGPSMDINDLGRTVLCKRGDPWYEETLTGKELDLLSGVYRVYSDHSNSYVGDMSWWPMPTTWEHGTMHLGYWTGFSEVWFQKRLDWIRSHEAQPKTALEWRDDLKRSHNAKKLHDMTHVASRKFLSHHGREIFSR